jgi:hypothetical protein
MANQLQPSTTIAVVDTGCTDHFLPPHYYVHNIRPTTTGILVGLPDTSTMQSTHTCTRNLPNLPHAAQSAHIFLKTQAALLSIPKLCDSGCTTRFSATAVIVTNLDGTVILVGTRDPTTKLCYVPLQSPKTHTIKTTTHTQTTHGNGRRQ